MKTPLRILFNDSHNNYPGSAHIPQGGPAVFAALFTSYFKNTPHHLISVFFSDNKENEEVSTRTILSKKQHDYVELIYPRKKYSATFKESYTKKEYLKFLAPLVEQFEKMMDEMRPDVVFLNGYALTNYLIFAAAKKKGIPVCIQHAGIWKEEIMIGSGSAFSPSITKIFVSMEKDLATYSTHHVFLNEHSLRRYLSSHNLEQSDLSHTSIIPLPIPTPRTVRTFNLHKKPNAKIAIGVVSRWDAIKNHSAVLRLGEYIASEHIPATVTAVTNPFNGVASEFRDRYTKYVEVIAPMNTAKLNAFYKTCDVLLLPSRFETLGGVIMEAAIQGVPGVISDQVGWVDEYRKYGLQSLIVSPNASGQEIYAAIKNLFDRPDFFTKKLLKFQNSIVKDHVPEKIFAKYEKIFISLSKEQHHG
jgi:glycosyltransferase involved in cell wall biosynthesis